MFQSPKTGKFESNGYAQPQQRAAAPQRFNPLKRGNSNQIT